MIKIFVISCLYFLSSCSVYQNYQAEKEAKKLDQYIINVNAFCDKVLAPFENGPLANKLPNLNNLSVIHLANKEFVTAAEQKMLLAREAALDSCNQKQREVDQVYYPEYVSIHNDSAARSKQIIAALYNRQITFGQANRFRQENSQAFNKEWNKLSLQLQGLEIQRQGLAEAEAARRAAAYKPFRLPTQKNIYVPRKTQTTNCDVWGNTINCTTR